MRRSRAVGSLAPEQNRFQTEEADSSNMGTARRNPVRGCLFVEKRAREDTLIVFRRRRLDSFNASINSRANRRLSGLVNFAPPKNNKGEWQIGGRFYNQVTPNGVTAPILQELP